MPGYREHNDEFIVCEYTNTCHRAFCQSARQMGKKWYPVKNPAEASARNAKPCKNCMPDKMLAGDTETMILHMPDCSIPKRQRFQGQYFETVLEAYQHGYEFRGCCAPPGIYEYVERLQTRLDEAE